MNKHYVNEVGTQLILDTGVLISTATEVYIKFRNPASVVGSFSASLYSSYSQLAQATGTYLITHTLVASDFTVPGKWKLQAYVGAVAGTWLGETVDLRIFDTYE